MNVILRNLIILGFIFMLAGCGFDNNDTKNNLIEPEETKEIILSNDEKNDIFNKIDTASNEVEIYDVIMKLGLEEIVGENKTVSRYELNGKIEEATINLDLTTTDTTAGNTNKLHVYKLDGKVYVKNNDEAWMETVEQDGEFSNDDTFYSNLTAALDEIIDEVELVEIDDVYEIRYTGNDKVIFDAFQQPFNLRLPGVDIQKEAEMKLVAVIDKETLYIQNLQFEILAEKEPSVITMSVDVDYKDINDTTIEIPKEVIDEATVDFAASVIDSSGTAINQDNTNELLDELFKAPNVVNVYDVKMDLVIEQIQGQNKDSSTAELNGTIDETTLNTDLITIETSGQNKNESHSYQTDDLIYVKNNDEDWVKNESPAVGFNENSTTYHNLSAALESIREKIKIFELNDEYEIRYTGSDMEVFNAFEKPFNLKIAGADIENDSELILIATIDKDLMLINDLYFGVFIEVNGSEVSIVTNVKYENINDTIVEVPQEVIEKTK